MTTVATLPATKISVYLLRGDAVQASRPLPENFTAEDAVKEIEQLINNRPAGPLTLDISEALERLEGKARRQLRSTVETLALRRSLHLLYKRPEAPKVSLPNVSQFRSRR